MFGMGMPEILLLLAIALIVIGPKKLPDLARSLGRAMGEFKKATSDLKDSLQADTGLSEVKGAFDEMNRDLRQSVSDSSTDSKDNQSWPRTSDYTTSSASATTRDETATATAETDGATAETSGASAAADASPAAPGAAAHDAADTNEEPEPAAAADSDQEPPPAAAEPEPATARTEPKPGSAPQPTDETPDKDAARHD